MDSEEETKEVEEIPESKQEIYCREICRGDRMSPYDAKGVYKTKAEVDRAIRDGTFDIAKTMYVDKNNNIFFLAYDNGRPVASEK